MLTFILVALIITFCLAAITVLGGTDAWAEALLAGLSLAAIVGLLVLRKAGLV